MGPSFELLTRCARRAVGGLIEYLESLTAMGNNGDEGFIDGEGLEVDGGTGCPCLGNLSDGSSVRDMDFSGPPADGTEPKILRELNPGQ